MNTVRPTLVLASASSARRQLLVNAGITPTIQPSHFDESTITSSDPLVLVQRLALSKAELVASQYLTNSPGLVVLGCDSVLVINGEIHGKPKDTEEAVARWQSMRGQTGELVTGHALIDVAQQQTVVDHRITEVEFAMVSDRQIQAYIASGEPMHCAGCFTLEGKGSAFIEKIVGCYSNVLGLSMPLLRQMLDAIGYDITHFWAEIETPLV